MQPLVSVVMPVHNGRRHIRASLDCILAQTYAHHEILVVDDGSTDGTSGMLDAEYGAKIRLVRKPQAGHPAARNTGIGAATGEFLSFLDHDDLWPEDKTAIQMECFAADAALDMVLGHLENFFDDELTAEDRRKIAAPMHPLEGLHPGTMLVRRSSFDRVGLFCETEQMGDFLDWYGRATIRGLKMKMLPQTLMRRRIHTTNFSRTHTSLRRHYLVRLKHLLDMRRVEAAKNGL